MRVKATRDARGRFLPGMSGETHPQWKGGSISWNGYRLISITEGDKKVQRREHRLIWERAHGLIPSGMILHHKNGDKLDNRLENLEPVTREEHPRIHFSKPAKPCSECYRSAKAHGLCALHCKELKRYGRILTDEEHLANREKQRAAARAWQASRSPEQRRLDGIARAQARWSRDRTRNA